jgi:hypothetical protein
VARKRKQIERLALQKFKVAAADAAGAVIVVFAPVVAH